MLPVSGAWQLIASGPRSLLQPESSAIGAYSSWVSPDSAGRNRFHRPWALRLLLQLLDDGRDGVVVGPGAVPGGEVLRLGRQDVVAHEREHAVVQLAARAEGAGRS